MENQQLNPNDKTEISLTYISESGSKYQITDSGVIIKNGGVLRAENGAELKYEGITDYEKGRRILNGELCSPTQSEKPAKQLIYEICQRLYIENVPFTEIKSHIDDRVGIVSINHEAKRADISAIIVNHE